MESAKIAIFKGKGVRRVIFNNEWYFSVVDIIEVLTDSTQPSKYWTAMKARVSNDDGIQLSTICRRLKLESTFGVTPSEYKKLKGLKRENLRDHMNDFELIFNMLGERATTEIHRNEDSKGFLKLKADAQAGGEIAGVAKEKLEKRLGRSIISDNNYLSKPENKKKLK